MSSLRPEELHEALFHLFVPLLRLLRLDGEQLQIAEFGLVSRILHLRAPGIEAFAVSEELPRRLYQGMTR